MTTATFTKCNGTWDYNVIVDGNTIGQVMGLPKRLWGARTNDGRVLNARFVSRDAAARSLINATK